MRDIGDGRRARFVGIALIGVMLAACASGRSASPSTSASIPNVTVGRSESIPITSAVTTTSTTAVVPETTRLPGLEMPPLPRGEVVGFSLPPRFGAVGVDMPLVVYTADVS